MSLPADAFPWVALAYGAASLLGGASFVRTLRLPMTGGAEPGAAERAAWFCVWLAVAALAAAVLYRTRRADGCQRQRNASVMAEFIVWSTVAGAAVTLMAWIGWVRVRNALTAASALTLPLLSVTWFAASLAWRPLPRLAASKRT